jgi:5'-3' exonuclease
MQLLGDMDLIIYKCAASAEHEEFSIAQSRVNALLDQIILKTEATEYRLFLSGKGNFRKAIYPEYKANRTQPKPKHLQGLREWSCEELGAEVTENEMEADDYMGIYQDKENNTTVIASLDKDLLMIPGLHFQWQFGTSKWTKEEKFITQTDIEGLRLFYEQCLKGDKADNVKGIAGLGEVKARKLLADCTTEKEMLDVCLEQYGLEEEFLLNAQCLWILRSMDDSYLERYNGLK